MTKTSINQMIRKQISAYIEEKHNIMTSIDHSSNRELCATPTVWFAPQTTPRRHSLVRGGCELPWFATVSQTAAVCDIILNRFSDMHASCAAVTSHINPPSLLSSHAVVLSQVFHAPRIQTRRCPIHSWHSLSYLTPFAFTHAAVLASQLFHPLRIPARCSSRIRTHFLRLFSLSVFARPCPRIRWHFLCFS